VPVYASLMLRACNPHAQLTLTPEYSKADVGLADLYRVTTSEDIAVAHTEGRGLSEGRMQHRCENTWSHSGISANATQQNYMVSSPTTTNTFSPLKAYLRPASDACEEGRHAGVHLQVGLKDGVDFEFVL